MQWREKIFNCSRCHKEEKRVNEYMLNVAHKELTLCSDCYHTFNDMRIQHYFKLVDDFLKGN